jgi:hypothetical protein
MERISVSESMDRRRAFFLIMRQPQGGGFVRVYIAIALSFDIESGTNPLRRSQFPYTG